jgi:exodeoxyribonuclease V gamma subunit
MCALRLYTSNRLEDLAAALSRVLEQPLSSPVAPEIVVVQSKGMEHWLSLELARRHGVCANVIFPFPNRFVGEMDRLVSGGTSLSTAFEPVWLGWRILRLLETLKGRQEFGEVREYLSGDDQGLRLLQFAERMADTFDQYLVYRPDMIARWERGEDDRWQAVLWREIVREVPREGHRAARAEAVVAALASMESAGALPERVSVFGISALPRFHMDILASLARLVPVNLFLMNPCREYWGDIVSDRDISRAEAGAPDAVAASDLHLEKGHPILASTGMMGRDFFDMIQEYPLEEQDFFLDPGEGCLLHAVQSDILFLRDTGEAGEKRRVSPSDDSIRVHSCHSPLREVEALRDRLLELFESDRGLGPADVMVTMPDIEVYAPFIRAVFDAPAAGELRIPYSVADRTIGRESRLIESFMSLLELPRDRYSLSRVLALLEAPWIRRRFEISENDLQLIRTWAAGAGIRWGLDGRDMAESGLPPFEENTWSAGLDRLLLGYAMAGGGSDVFAGILPLDYVEGGGADVLEKLLDFTDALRELLPRLSRPRSPAAWGETLSRILERFFEPDEDEEPETSALRRVVNELTEASNPAGAAVELDLHLEAVRWLLGRRFEKEGLGFGFMTGGVTFCAMLPMRSIPFRVICCLGLDSGAFPRTHRPLEFDLIARHPRPGDRSRRKDDRYLFLEMILSARDHLLLSYVGQSLQDNTSVPPSPLVTELLEVVDRGFETEGGGSVPEKIVVRHHLQPFNPEYFSGEGGSLYSYSGDNLLAARALAGPQQGLPPFFPERLSEPDPGWKEVDLENLVRFFRNPSEFILRRRLGVRLEKPEELPEDREAFSIQGLLRYQLGRDLVRVCLEGEDPFEGYEAARASGAIPPGAAGRALYEGLAREAAAFVEQTSAFPGRQAPRDVEVELRVGDFLLTGRLEIYPDSGLVHRRFASLKPVDRLNGWIRHLVMNVAGVAPRGGAETLIIGLNTRKAVAGWTGVRFGPLDEALSILKGLLLLYGKGLRRPLPFFPKSSWAYAHEFSEKGSSKRTAVFKARQAWEGNPHKPGEKDDPYIKLCFRGLEPIEAEDFHRTSLEILGPLMNNQAAPA